MAAILPSSLDTARQTLDDWVREVVAWHFDPQTGCPFWLGWAARAGWDPRKDVRGYADLDKFGFFEDEWLRGGALRQWVPHAYDDRPVYVFETGGSTGVPKSRINIDDFRIDYEAFSATLPSEAFPWGADWLSIGPSGPRRLRLAVEHLAQFRGGICFMVDLDPRWVIKLLKRQELEEAELYKRHVIDQALALLRAHDSIKCLFTTPKLLEALCERTSLRRLGITGVFCGGTEMTPQFHRFAVEELLEGAYFAPTYGNTLMGLATHKPPEPRGRLGHHLLPARSPRDDGGGGPRPAARSRRLRPDGSRPADHPHEGVLHAALPGAGSGGAGAAVPALSVGRRAQRAAVLADRDEGGGRAFTDAPAPAASRGRLPQHRRGARAAPPHAARRS